MSHYNSPKEEIFERLTAAGIHLSGKFRDAKSAASITPHTLPAIISELSGLEIGTCIEGLMAVPIFATHPTSCEFSPRTDRLRRKYLEYKKIPVLIGDDDICLAPVRIQWENIHGKNRRRLRYLLKQVKRQYLTFVEIDNRYAGRDDVVRIYTSAIRDPDLSACREKSWFLDMAEDPYYSSPYRKYVYIWAKIEPGLLDQSVSKKGEMV